MTKQKLLLDGTISLFLIVACEAQQLPRSHVAAGSGPLCEKEAESWGNLFSSERLDAWICSLIGSFMVGLSGVFPLLVIPFETGAALQSEAGSHRLKQLLSFAIGGLLGNVFLHLLPEAWAYTCSATTGRKALFVVIKLGYQTPAGKIPNGSGYPLPKVAGQSQRAGTNSTQCNGSSLQSCPTDNRIKISGYLNLLANTIDNFTHGLAVAASFLVSRKVGFLTTMAILLHEIPHEVGDFAILLRAGFDRWSAAKMQLSTALGGILGACFAICAQSPKGAGETVAWILPFTSGGFLYIALVNVVPDLLEEKNPWNSLQQILLLCTGITVMVLLSIGHNN
uniref:Zinc transporter ZIP13 n=1 Tax=Buteo japonicus TaxID=224669 RepID=A0A8C0BZW8_9AVES